jgi:peroxiredoxin
MGINIGDVAPDFTATDVVSGTTINLSDYVGQVALVAFAGPSWCGPCQFEAPVLQDLWEDINLQSCHPPPQFLMIGVNETQQSLKSAATGFGLTFPALFDGNGGIAAQYGVEGVPEVFIIGTDGKVCRRVSGAITPATAMYDELRDALLDCGACKKHAETPDISRWAAIVHILFGVIQDGGGLAIGPGGKPHPIDPWGPLKLSPAKRNVLASLAISELSKTMKDPKAAQAIEATALKSAEASMKLLSGRASRKVALPAQASSKVTARK